jgi:hypothetical protein
MAHKSGDFWRIFLIWVAANVVGFVIPPLVPLLFPSVAALSGFFGTLLLISLPLGIAQWLALRRILPVAVWWIITIPVSVMFFILAIREIPESYWQLIESEASFVFFGIYFILGLMTGLPQWLILRLQVDPSSIWLVSSAIGVGLGVTFVTGTNLINSSGVFAYMVAVLFYVVTTGLTLSILISGKNAAPSTVTKTV